MKRLLFATLAGLVLFGLTLQAATIAVPGDQPAIQAGINAALSGDTVLVGPGAWLESVNFDGKAISLRSQLGPSRTILQPRHPDSATITINSGEAAGTEVVGFSFRGGSRRSIITLGGGATVRILGNRFTESSGYEPVIRCDGARTTIERNVFFNTYGPACIGVFDDTVTVVNNTLYGTSRGIFVLGGFAEVRNCIIAGQTEYGFSGDSISSDYNVFRANGQNFINGAQSGIHDLFADPGVTAADFHDFTLRDTSICIDAGDPDSLALDPDSSRNDIGAYPFGTILSALPNAVDFTVADQQTNRVTDSTPIFTWRFYDSTGAASAFELEVGSDNNWTSAELWQPGVQSTGDSSIQYGGAPLIDGSVYFARLRLNNGIDWGDWRTFGFAVNTPPDSPLPAWPLEGDSLSVDNVYLTVTTSPDSDSDSLRYDFYIFGDSMLSDTIAVDSNVVGQPGQTSSRVFEGLDKDTTFWWQARAFDGYEYSASSDSNAFRTFQGPRTLRVPSKYPSIKAAVTAAATGDTVLVADGVYSGPDNRRITFGAKQIRLVSENGRESTIIDCLDTAGVQHWGIRTGGGQDSATVVEGFTIRHASAAFLLEAAPRIRQLRFDNNDIGILAYGDFAASLDSCSFIDNDTGLTLEGDFALTLNDNHLADNLTAALVFDASLHLRHATLDSNVRAVYVSGGTATIDSCTFIGNNAALKSNLGSFNGVSYIHGGEFIDNELAALGDLFIDGASISGGGTAIETVFPDRAMVQNCVITGVTDRVLYQQYTRLTAPGSAQSPASTPGLLLTNCTITDNPGAVGEIESGVDGDYSVLRLDSCRIIGNGGGLTFNGILEMNQTVFAYNGGLLAYRINDWVTGPHAVDQCTFVGNTGGALAITGEEGRIDITRSIIAGNDGIGLSYVTDNNSVGIISCNNVHDNSGGNFDGLLDPTGLDGNISLLTRFCAADSLDFSLYDIAVCAPANNSCSTQIGALPVICFNQPPSLVSPDTLIVFEDSLLVYDILFADDDGPDTTVLVENLPSWLSISNDTVSGVPTEGISDSSFVVILSDGFAFDTTTVAVLVTPVNDPPVLDTIEDQFAVELDTLTLPISATDIDSDSLILSVDPLPPGASLIGSGNGSALFIWPLDTLSAGTYDLWFIASDTLLADSQLVTIQVQSRRPTILALTIDGMDTARHVTNHTPEVCWSYVDSAYGAPQSEVEIAVGDDNDWEFAEIWNPAPFISSDSCLMINGAPLVDGAEYFLRLRVRNDTLYSAWYEKSFRMNSRPSAPILLSPESSVRVDSQQPILTVSNASDAEGDSLFYEFVIYADSLLDSLVSLETLVEETPDSSSVIVSPVLDDNTYYWWRVRAFDGFEFGAWSDSACFRIDLAPQPPTSFVLIDQAVDSGGTLFEMLPAYRWSSATDPDPDDTVRYRMLLSRDGFASDTIRYDSIADTTFTLPDSLEFNTRYEWRLEAFDATGLVTLLPERLYFYTWLPGDLNRSQTVTLTDLTLLVNMLFVTFQPVSPYFIADMNASCTVSLTDVQFLVNYLFLLGPHPRAGCASPPVSGPTTDHPRSD